MRTPTALSLRTTLAAVSLLATLGAPRGLLAAGGVFPAEPFNGMQLTYDVAGATLDAPLDAYGFTCRRELSGTASGATVTISGAARASNGVATLSVRVDGQTKPFTAEWNKKVEGTRWDQPFSVTVPVTPGQRIGFEIKMSGYYNVGTRTLIVGGSLSAPSGPPPPSPPKPALPGACETLRLDLEEGANDTVVVTVVDTCDREPVLDVLLETRIFHTFDNRLCKAINGEYVDLAPEKIPGRKSIKVAGNPGDVYRVDAYVSKERYNRQDSSIHITIGGVWVPCPQQATPPNPPTPSGGSPRGPVAEYPFNGNARDESGNGNHGTVNGATLTADRFGTPNSAYRFDGSGQTITVPHSRTLSFSQDMTVSAWVNTADTFGAIAAQHNGGQDGNFLLSITDGKLLFGRSASFWTSAAVSDGAWHHVVGVYDATNHLVSHYVDGVMVSSRPDSEPLPNRPIALTFGDESNRAYGLAAVIDDVTLYDRALSAAEIKRLSSTASTSSPSASPAGSTESPANAAPAATGLVGHWTFSMAYQGSGLRSRPGRHQPDGCGRARGQRRIPRRESPRQHLGPGSRIGSRWRRQPGDQVSDGHSRNDARRRTRSP